MRVQYLKNSYFDGTFVIEGFVIRDELGLVQSIRVEGASHNEVRFPHARPSFTEREQVFRITGLVDSVDQWRQLKVIFEREGMEPLEHGQADMADLRFDSLRIDSAYESFIARLRLDHAAGRRLRVLQVGLGDGQQPWRDELQPDELVVLHTGAGAGIDVVGDPHSLSSLFPAQSFDYVVSRGSLERLAMPWKVVCEIARVLRKGGLCYVAGSLARPLQTPGLDFWRFSNMAWLSLFSPPLGFLSRTSALAGFATTVPSFSDPATVSDDTPYSFQLTSVLAERIGEPRVAWDVEAVALGLGPA